MGYLSVRGRRLEGKKQSDPEPRPHLVVSRTTRKHPAPGSNAASDRIQPIVAVFPSALGNNTPTAQRGAHAFRPERGFRMVSRLGRQWQNRLTRRLSSDLRSDILQHLFERGD